MDDQQQPLPSTTPTDAEVATQLYQLVNHLESQLNPELSTNWLMKRSLSHLARSLLFYSLATRQQPVNIDTTSPLDKPTTTAKVDPNKIR
ncbi:hypothetical protein [Nostoc sp.]|uniref:hypothetical protein n=1 Tax=Nostoc sp. TaxID=1180 RepID=UPI002FFA1040